MQNKFTLNEVEEITKKKKNDDIDGSVLITVSI